MVPRSREDASAAHPVSFPPGSPIGTPKQRSVAARTSTRSRSKAISSALTAQHPRRGRPPGIWPPAPRLPLAAAGWPQKLTELVLGSEQKRALRQAADAAVWATCEEVSLSGGEQAGQVAMVISEVFRDPVPDAPLAGPVMLLEGL